MSDTDRRERFWWRWLARAGIACGILFVLTFYSHFSLGRRPEGIAERWSTFWGWAFGGTDGLSVMAAGYLALNASFSLRLLTRDRPPDAERDVPLLVLTSSGLTATVIFLLALAPICFG